MHAAQIAAAQIVLLLGEHDDRAAFWRFVGERSELRRVGQSLLADIRGGNKLGGLAIAQCDGAGLVEQKVFTSPAASTARPLMASTLYCTRRSMPAMPMAESRPPMVVGMRQTSSETSTKTVCGAFEYIGEGLQRDDREQKHDRKAGKQNTERDFVRCLLPRRAFDQRDHAIEKCFAGIGSNANLDPVGEHFRAARDRGAIAAGLADHRRGFTGDGRLVNRSNTFDDFTVACDVAARFHVDDVAGAQQPAGDLFEAAVERVALGDGLAFGFAQRVGLCLAAAFGHGFSKVCEQHREPEPQRDLQIEAEARAVMYGVVDEQGGGQHAADFHNEHHRILDHASADRACARIIKPAMIA